MILINNTPHILELGYTPFGALLKILLVFPGEKVELPDDVTYLNIRDKLSDRERVYARKTETPE